MRGDVTDALIHIRQAGSTIHPLTERRIALRWQWWLPLVSTTPRDIDYTRRQHRERCLSMLKMGLQWRRIADRRLDDPLISITEWRDKMEYSMKKREAALAVAARPEHKGIRKGHSIKSPQNTRRQHAPSQ